MSQTNNTGEEGEQGDPVSEEFEFYFPFAKTLALDLTTPEDTSIAAAWVQKLEAEPESEEEKRTRLNYLKLLLFVLQRGRLSGIFKKQPPSGALQPFPQGLSILDMGNLMLDQDDSPSCGEGDARCLPYTIEISNDLREFVASQEIPNFGIQMYYAWSSDDPVHKWMSFDEEKFPQFVLDKIKQLKEIRSDEKSTIIKNGCVTTRKGCDLPVIEKCSKKRVKTPQEIERSQGRSFHTYMGLVGRMGNFDKCDDDQDKSQRQDPRKGKHPKRNGPKRYTGSGGEAEDMPTEEDLDNVLSGLGGLNNQNGPCSCPYPSQHANCPDHFGKGGPQPFENQSVPRNCNYSARAEVDNSQWNAAVNRTPPSRRYNTEQCLESELSQPVQSQRRTSPQRPKSSSPNRVNECPPQGRVAMNPNCSYPKQDGGNYRRDGDPCFNAFQGSGSCPPGQGRPDQGSRSSGRGKHPQVVHCFDAQNPDPCLTQAMEKNWSEELDIAGFVDKICRRTEKPAPCQKPNTQARRELFDVQQQGRVCTPPPTTSPCHQPNGMSRMGQQKPEMYSPPSVGQRLQSPPPPRSPRTPSPQACGRPVCGAQQEPPQQCRPNHQVAFASQQGPQDYQECEDAMPQQMHPGFVDPCARPPQDPCRPSSQPANRSKNMPCYSTGPLTMNNNSERLASMVNVLQGIKQRTEAHREKCDQGGPRKSPVNDASYCQGTGQPPTNVCLEQPPPDGAMFSNYCPESRPPRTPVCPDTGAFMRHPATYPKAAAGNKCPSHLPSRGYVSITGTFQGKSNFITQPPPCQPVQPCSAPYSNRMPEACDAGEEEEDECESSESGDVCPQETLPKYEMPTCPPQKIPGRTPQQGTCNAGNVQPCGPQGVMSGRPNQAPGSKLWTEIPCSTSPKPNQGRCPQGESRPIREPEMQTCGPQKFCPGRSPKQEQPSYREPELQSAAPKRISPGKTVSQDPRVFQQPEMQSYPPKRPSPGKQVQQEQFQIPQEWEEMPSSASQMESSGSGKGSRSKEGQVQSYPPRKMSPGPGKPIQEELCNEDYDDMPSSASAMARQGAYQAEPHKGSPRKKSPVKIQQEAEEWLDMSSNITHSSSPGRSFQNEGVPNKGGDVQTCSPRKPSPGKPPQQISEDWEDMTTSSSSRTDSKRSDATPTCFPLQYITEGNVLQPVPVRQVEPQSCGSQRNNAGPLKVKQEGSKTCAPQNCSPQRVNPRTQPSQNKLTRQKSSPRQSQSKSKQVQKSSRIPSKSEVRTETKSKTISKTTTKNKSDPSMKIKPEIINMKVKPKSKTTFKSPSKDLMFETKRKTPQQMSFKKPEQPECYNMAELQNCVELMQESIPGCRGNPYVENSMSYHRTRPAMVKSSTPVKWMNSVSQDVFPTISSIHQYDSRCEFNNPNPQIQMEFCEEDEDENVEYMPLCSVNADINASKFFNLLQCPPETAQCQRPPEQRPRNPEQEGTSCQSFQEEDNFDECDNPRGGSYY